MLKEIYNLFIQPHPLAQSQISRNTTMTHAASQARTLGVTFNYSSSVKSMLHQSTGPTGSTSQKDLYLDTSPVFISTTLVEGTTAFFF